MNPKRPHVLGILAFQSMAACPGQVDLAIVVTPASTVPSVIQDCVDQKVGEVEAEWTFFDSISVFRF